MIKTDEFQVDWFYRHSKYNVITACALYVMNNDTIVHVFTGSYSNEPYTRHIKEEARKNSLKDAMREFPRDYRTKVWKAYFNRKKESNIEK